MGNSFKLPSTVFARAHMAKLMITLLALVAFLFGLVMMHAPVSPGIDARVAVSGTIVSSSDPATAPTVPTSAGTSESGTTPRSCAWNCEGRSAPCTYSDVDCNVVASPTSANVSVARPEDSGQRLDERSATPKAIIGQASHLPEPDRVFLSISRI